SNKVSMRRAAQSGVARRSRKIESGDQCERLHSPHLNGGRCFRWKLKHCRLLTFNQASQQHHLAIWKFQSVMMCVGFVLVDLPKDCCRVIDGFCEPAKATYFRCKGKLSSRKNANCHVGVFRRSKTSGARAEVVSCQFVANLGWS